jgi:hypothetical protein
MIPGVQFDVAFEVVAQSWGLALDEIIRLQQALEQGGDDMLAAMKKGCRYTVSGRVRRHVQGGADEAGHARRRVNLVQGRARLQPLA